MDTETIVNVHSLIDSENVESIYLLIDKYNNLWNERKKYYFYINLESELNSLNKKAIELFNALTEKDIENNFRRFVYMRPFLHEIVHLIPATFELMKIAWNTKLLQKYWNNSKYIEMTNKTVVDTLANNKFSICDMDIHIWIKKI